MPLTILIADDDLAVGVAIHDYLEMAGYTVVTALNGQDALEKVEIFQPHLLVTDISMPRMDGYELVQRIRQRPAWRLLPVVFLTAHTTKQERIRGYQTGCDVYLAKPFELDELGAIVRNLLERNQIIQTQVFRSELQIQMQQEPAVSRNPVASTMSIVAPIVELTDREQDVLQLLAEGFSNNQIGDHLHLSPRTIEKYVSSLLRKTDASNRAELVRFAMSHHLVT